METQTTIFDLFLSVKALTSKTAKRIDREYRIADWLLNTDEYSDLIRQAKKQTEGVQLENVARTLQGLLFSKGLYYTPDNDYFSLSALRLTLAEERDREKRRKK